MAKDAFERIFYPKEVDGKKKRSSVSIDADLYAVFCLIRGDAAGARRTLRAWAVEIEQDRMAVEYDGIGCSRLVHRRILAEIKELVQKGLTIQEGGRRKKLSV